MLAAFIIVFREILEVAIVLGIVVAATRGLPDRVRYIWLGIAGGITGSLLVAYFAEAISEAASGMGQELFNAGVLLAASAMIGWTVLWMQAHAKEMVANIKRVGAQVVEGSIPAYAVSMVVALAVLREGAEIVLFTHGMLASGQAASSILSGGLVGLLAGSVLGYLLYRGIVTIPTKYVFRVTSWMLIVLAAGMASLAAKYLVASGEILFMTETLWDSSWLLSEDSLLGQILHAMIGYSDQPMAIQLVFFVVVLCALAAAQRWIDQRKAKTL